MDWLLQRNASDETKLEINKFIASQPEDEREWYKRMLLKDLKEGCTESTYNKIWSNLVPTFDVMLAKKFEEHEHKIKDDFVVTLKLDGVRCAVLKENGSIKLISRQGKLFEDLNELTEELKQLPDNTVYDGELLLANDKNLDSADLYRETMKEVSKIGEKHNVEFHCFDIIPIEDFKAGKSKDKCIKRKETLHQLLQQYDFKLIKEVPVLYKGRDKEEVFRLLDEVTQKGLEGVMVNQNMQYFCKRSDAILKVKKMNDCDLKIVGFESGEVDSKLANTLGRINVEYKGNVVGVGSGFSEEMRNEIWNNQGKYINRIAKIQFFEESENSKTKEKSLRFPVFIEIRWDKNEPSYN
jgi:DNA ligase-1